MFHPSKSKCPVILIAIEWQRLELFGVIIVLSVWVPPMILVWHCFSPYQSAIALSSLVFLPPDLSQYLACFQIKEYHHLFPFLILKACAKVYQSSRVISEDWQAALTTHAPLGIPPTNLSAWQFPGCLN